MFPLCVVPILLLLSSPAAFPAPPDARALAARAVELNLADWDKVERYIYVERVDARRLGGDGSVKSRKNKTHEVRMIEGTPYRRLLLENDQPVSAEETAMQQEALRRHVEARGAESPREREKRVSAYRKKRQEYKEALSEIPAAFNFRLLGEDSVDGRPAWLLELTPRPGFRPRNRYARLFTAVKGKAWIDQASGHWARLEAESFESIWFGWILVRIREGAKLRMEQMRLNDDLWMPKGMRYSAALRVGLVYGFGVEEDASYRDYRPLPAEAAEGLPRGKQ